MNSSAETIRSRSRLVVAVVPTNELLATMKDGPQPELAMACTPKTYLLAHTRI